MGVSRAYLFSLYLRRKYGEKECVYSEWDGISTLLLTSWLVPLFRTLRVISYYTTLKYV